MIEAGAIVVGAGGSFLLLSAWYAHRQAWMLGAALTLALATGMYTFLIWALVMPL